jgi:hypothetical protein
MHHEGQRNSFRELVWVEGQDIGGWGCSACAWMFKPSVGAVGASVRELIDDAQRQLEEEFLAHECTNYLHVRTG